MKRKDIIVLTIALVVVMGAGYLYLNQNSPKGAAKSSVKTAEVVPVITGSLDADNTLSNLQTKYQVRDYKQAFDTEQGLDNSAPFAR